MAKRKKTKKRKKATKKKATRKKATRKKATRKAAGKKRRTTRKKAKKTKKKAAKRKTKSKSKRKPNAAFMRPMKPSAALADVIGGKAIPRTQVVKKLWAYIKKNKLQDTKNKRNINADAKLSKVFRGKKTVSMFEMTKLVSKHLS